MRTYSYSIEGMDLEIEAHSKDEIEASHSAFLMRAIRNYSGMSRNEFCNWLDIPYRTLQEWERGGRVMPGYVLNLIAYKVRIEKAAGRI